MKPVVLSIIIVHYKTRELTLQCLRSIREFRPRVSHEILLIDNGSQDDIGTEVAERFPEVRLIETGRNDGFSQANNLGIVNSLPKADVVYSWGVLHHTRHVWRAIENACLPLKDDGVFFIALYSHTAYENGVLSGHPSPEEWLKIKQAYNQASKEEKKLNISMC
jgi:glycosyltransferase involved in cell wall biosynthesis